MARDWQAVAEPKAGEWNIPAPTLTELGVRVQAADAALAAAQNETTRTPVATARRRETFDALAVFMRDMKRRYFLTPPLTDSDYAALGLKPHDTTQTPSGAPTAQTTVETFLVGRHELGIRIVYVTGSPDEQGLPRLAQRGRARRNAARPPGGSAEIVFYPAKERCGGVRL